jgi:hypothetical protein
MRFNECEAMLSIAPLDLERVLKDLKVVVCISPSMCLENCTADMLRYWFGSEFDTVICIAFASGSTQVFKWGEFEPNKYKRKCSLIETTYQGFFRRSEVMHMQLKF